MARLGPDGHVPAAWVTAPPFHDAGNAAAPPDPGSGAHAAQSSEYGQDWELVLARSAILAYFLKEMEWPSRGKPLIQKTSTEAGKDLRAVLGLPILDGHDPRISLEFLVIAISDVDFAMHIL